MGARGPSRQPLELDLLRGGRGKRPTVAPQPVEDNPPVPVRPLQPPHAGRGRALAAQPAVPVRGAVAAGAQPGHGRGDPLESTQQVPVLLAGDAVLPSDGGRAYPSCARRLGVHQHEAVNVWAGAVTSKR